MIPEAVVQEAFGAGAEITELEQITKGRSGALVYRAAVGGRGSRYLLRVVTRKEDPTLSDHFACMRIAAEGGLAPSLLYTNLEHRISIADFIETVPFSMAEGRVRMPGVLRKLHGLPSFPKRVDHLNTTCTFLLKTGAAREGFLQRLQTVFPADVREEVFARFAEITAAYRTRESDFVSCHNDLFKPDNILFDGNRVWLVDWEAAFLNDRYADLAVVANMVVAEGEDGAFLREYFGAPADEEQLARLFVMRQLAHFFYAGAFLMMGSAAGSEPMPEAEELRRRFWDGEFALTDPETKGMYGRYHLAQFLMNTRPERFGGALRMVAG